MSDRPTKHDPYLAFRSFDFRMLFAASTINVIGAGMEATALGWELYERTGDALVLGNIGVSGGGANIFRGQQGISPIALTGAPWPFGRACSKPWPQPGWPGCPGRKARCR